MCEFVQVMNIISASLRCWQTKSILSRVDSELIFAALPRRLTTHRNTFATLVSVFKRTCFGSGPARQPSCKWPVNEEGLTLQNCNSHWNLSKLLRHCSSDKLVTFLETPHNFDRSQAVRSVLDVKWNKYCLELEIGWRAMHVWLFLCVVADNSLEAGRIYCLIGILLWLQASKMKKEKQKQSGGGGGDNKGKLTLLHQPP